MTVEAGVHVRAVAAVRILEHLNVDGRNVFYRQTNSCHAGGQTGLV